MKIKEVEKLLFNQVSGEYSCLVQNHQMQMLFCYFPDLIKELRLVNNERGLSDSST